MKFRIFSTLILAVLISFAPVQAGKTHFKGLPMALDFESDGQSSRKTGRPIMVFFAVQYCGYCQEISELYLRPMYESGSHEDRVLLRVIEADNEAARLRGFDGNKTYHSDFASRNAASMTPIIKFFDHNGKELVPEIFGYSSPDFWGLYLEKSINLAVEKLRKQSSHASLVIPAASAR